MTLICEDCGREMKSKGGLTLHKKKCKPKEMLEQMQISLTGKLLALLEDTFKDCEVYGNTATIVLGDANQCMLGNTKHKWIRKTQNFSNVIFPHLQVKCVFIKHPNIPRLGLRIDDGQVAFCTGQMNGKNDIYIGKEFGDPEWDIEVTLRDTIKIIRKMIEIGEFAEETRK